MYLRTLRTRNLKRLRDFTLDFTHDGSPRMWTVLIGENGTAKTSILQAIALAAAGSAQVNTLARTVVRHLRDRRAPANAPLTIEADFGFGPRAMEDRVDIHPLDTKLPPDACLRSRLDLPAKRTSFTGEAKYYVGNRARATPRDPLDDARSEHRQLWFVAGYGVSRALADPEHTPSLDLPSIERLAALFETRSVLASTSFSNHFAKKDLEEGRKRGDTSRTYARMLGEIVKRGGEDLLPGIVKLELRGQGGAQSAPDLVESDRFQQRFGASVLPVAGAALSHGFQSTFAWISDLVGHVLLESKTELSPAEIEGLVLLDEIDLYLHPQWQATFVSALRRLFPRVQFVVTTHSPVILATVAPHEVVRLVVDPESGDVVRGAWDEDGELEPTTKPEPPQPDPRSMTGNELYRTWFGLDRSTPNQHGADLRRYTAIATDPDRTSAEDAELPKLSRRLERGGITELAKPVPRSARSEKRPS